MSNTDKVIWELGSRIRNIRESKDLNLTTLAQMAGVSKSYLSHIETGKADSPSLKILSKIAQALGISLGALLGISPLKEQSSETFLDDLDRLPGAKTSDKNTFKQAVRFVKLGLADESEPVEKRREFAQIVISLVKLFFR